MINLFNQIIKTNQSFLITDVYFTNWKNYTMEYHHHDCLEINYITSGTCIYHVNSNKYLLKKKNLLILDSSVPHKLEFISSHPCLILGMSYKSIPKKSGLVYLNDIASTSQSVETFFENFKVSMTIQDAHSIYPILQSIAKEYHGENNPIYQNILLTKTLIDVSRLILNDNQQSINYIDLIKDYIQFNYFSINNIDEIADYVGLNKIYMQRLFKQYNNKTIWNYLTELRIKEAAHILKFTDIPVGDIDKYVGINSRQNFYILFKKIYGVSPSEYRKSSLNNKNSFIKYQ